MKNIIDYVLLTCVKWFYKDGREEDPLFDRRKLKTIIKEQIDITRKIDKNRLDKIKKQAPRVKIDAPESLYLSIHPKTSYELYKHIYYKDELNILEEDEETIKDMVVDKMLNLFYSGLWVMLAVKTVYNDEVILWSIFDTDEIVKYYHTYTKEVNYE